VLWHPPPPSFVRVRWACAVATTASVLRPSFASRLSGCVLRSSHRWLHLTFGGLCRASQDLHPSSTSRVRLGVQPPSSRSRLAFSEVVLWRPPPSPCSLGAWPPLPLVRVSRSMKVRSHHCLSSHESVPASVSHLASGERRPLRFYLLHFVLGIGLK